MYLSIFNYFSNGETSSSSFDYFTYIDIVFHTAALKHVVLCERTPFEAVQTNIHGVQNVIAAAIDHDVERLIFTSSDKA